MSKNSSKLELSNDEKTRLEALSNKLGDRELFPRKVEAAKKTLSKIVSIPAI